MTPDLPPLYYSLFILKSISRKQNTSGIAMIPNGETLQSQLNEQAKAIQIISFW